MATRSRLGSNLGTLCGVTVWGRSTTHHRPADDVPRSRHVEVFVDLIRTEVIINANAINENDRQVDFEALHVLPRFLLRHQQSRLQVHNRARNYKKHASRSST